MSITDALKAKFFNKRKSSGLIMVEMVLLVPLFIILMLFMTKLFGFLIVIQKMEIASFYAARRWQLESHLNIQQIAATDGQLEQKIRQQVTKYMKSGADNNLFGGSSDIDITFTRTELWNVVQLEVPVKPITGTLKNFMCRKPAETVCKSYKGDDCPNGYKAICESGVKFAVIKYVPNRDRPIKYTLPGLQN